MSGRPVPWASWDEWQALRDNLWSTDPQRQEAGLQQLCAWRLRGKLPLGVDTTAHLMDVRRADADWQRSIARSTNAAPSSHFRGSPGADAAVAAGELPLRLRYSLPLIRLVNGISDSQQRGRVASSVAILSDAAGLPRALVDVRHEATHNELPSLPLLRAAADSALSWLWNNYWNGQSRALATAMERIGSLLAGMANSWRAATAAGLSSSAGALAAATTDEDEDEGDVDTEAAGSYNGSEGQRIRRQAMSELRSLVPPAFTHVLLQPILDCPVLLPPELIPVPQQQQQQRELVDAKAWRSTMKHLLKWYPRLRPLLLQAALQRLAAAATAAAENGSALPDNGQWTRAYGLWVFWLLPAGAVTAHKSGAGQAGKLATPSRKQGRASNAGGVGSTGAGGKASKKAAAAAASAPNLSTCLSGEDGGGGGSSSTCYGINSGDALLDGPLTAQQLHELLSIAIAAGDAFGVRQQGPDPGCASATTDSVEPGKSSRAKSAYSAGVEAAPSLDADRRRGDGAATAISATATLPDSSAALRDEGAIRPQILGDVIAAIWRAIAQMETASGSGRKRQRHTAATATEEPPTAGGGRNRQEEAAGQPGGPAFQPRLVRDDTSGTVGHGSDAADGGEKRRRHESQQHQQQPPARRWQLCSEWSRCAIGCLPCPLNPNGRLPPLGEPLTRAPLQPQPLLESGAATAADPGRAAATDAADDGGARAVVNTAEEYGNDDIEYYIDPLETDGPWGPQRTVTDLDGDRGVGGDDCARGRTSWKAGGEGEEEAAEDEPTGGHAARSVFTVLLQQQQREQEEGSWGSMGAAAVGFLL